MPPKSPLKSKTIWGNVIMIAIMILGYFVEITDEEKNIITAFIESPQTQLFFITIYNIVMRFFTKKPVIL